MNKKNPPHAIKAADAAKGAAAEVRFRQWLDASEWPHYYLDQTPLTVPAHLRGKLKRVDNIVGVPGIGQAAFDVKAKTVYQGSLIFDLDEVRKLRVFARLFHLTVFFACLDPEGGTGSYWVRLDQLAFVPIAIRAGKQTVALPLSQALQVDMAFNFADALLDATRMI